VLIISYEVREVFATSSPQQSSFGKQSLIRPTYYPIFIEPEGSLPCSQEPWCPPPYPSKSILQKSCLHNPLRKTIIMKYNTTVSNCFTVSKFLMRWMGLMKWYQFPNVWAIVTSIVNMRTKRSEGPTSSGPLGNPTAPKGAVQPTLGTTVLKH
jgi:hypothetical protein